MLDADIPLQNITDARVMALFVVRVEPCRTFQVTKTSIASAMILDTRFTIRPIDSKSVFPILKRKLRFTYA